MASPLDDQPVSDPSNSIHQRILSHFRGSWVSRLNVEQMFILIDGVLPFEACLYYQVLPLFLEGNRLHLGMVSPDDIAASEYARRIISYLNYSLVSHSISSEALRVVLTAYLNYVGNQQSSTARHESFSYGHYRNASRAKADRHADPNERLTLVVDSPDNLYAVEDGTAEITTALTPPPMMPPSMTSAARPLRPDLMQASSEPEPAAADIATAETAMPEAMVPEIMVPEAVPETGVPETGVPEAAVLETGVLETRMPDLPGSESPAPDGFEAAFPELPTPELAMPETFYQDTAPDLQPDHRSNLVEVSANGGIKKSLAMLQIEARYLSSSIEVLAALPPDQLIQELLARVLLGGIGRLYFECHPQYGRIVWSQNGILQSVLDELPLPVFYGLIQQLKYMAYLPLLPVEQPQQAEIEYLYNRNRVLLRYRFMPGQHGEEATIQVLRGAALKFYQQQQLSKLEKDAVSIAQQLQHKLNEIRAQAYTNPALLESNFEMLPKLNELLHNIEQQLDALNGHRGGRRS